MQHIEFKISKLYGNITTLSLDKISSFNSMLETFQKSMYRLLI